MRLLLPFALLPIALATPSQGGPQPVCRQATIPVTITANQQIINFAQPKNQSELTGLMTSFTSQNSNVTQDLVQGQKTFTATYKIWSLLCLPSGAKPSTVEFAVHGINFDHSYWNFGGEGSQYNYVDAAVRAGHAIFIYDRLGIGESSKPDGIKEVQENIEIEVAAELIKYIRRGATGNHFQQIVGIGHSLGSLQLAGVAAKYGNLLNATVLTGFTPFTGAFNTALAAFGLTIASVQNPSRFKSLESSYLATGTISNDQQPFFSFPFFDPNVLRSASETKQTSTIGEYLTLGANVASNYTNPVLVVTGDKDYIFCGGDCYQPFAGFDNLVLSAKVLFPNVAKFNYSIPANTGHAANLHFGSQNVFKTIQAWISEL